MKTLTIFTVLILASSLFVKGQNGDDKFGADPEECKKNISLYREYFKQKNHADALPFWRLALGQCPASTKNLYINGEVMTKARIGKEKDEARKSGLIDTLMLLYDMRIQHFDQKGYVLGKKGVDLFKYRDTNVQEVYGILKESFELENEKTGANALMRYFQVTEKLKRDEKLSIDVLMDTYDKVTGAIEKVLAQDPGNENMKKVKLNVEKLFGPHADCPALVSIYTPKVEESPTDTTLLMKVINFLDKKECKKEPLFMTAVKKLYEIKPSAVSAAALGKMNAANEKYDEAEKYYKEAINLQTNDEKRGQYCIELAQVFLRKNEHANARDFAKKAASARPKWGKPYILIGDLYATTAHTCAKQGSQTYDCESKVAYWAAVDKYKRAKSIDPEVAEEAGKRISKYKKLFPTAENCFFQTLQDGAEYTVGCWINEKTTVQLKK